MLKRPCCVCLVVQVKSQNITVTHATCTWKSCRGYCNHLLALMLKICKYILFESKTTEDQQFWDNMSDKLKAYCFQHFISFAVSE